MIEETRQQLIDDLTPTGVTVYHPYPDRVTAPCIVVGFDSSYIRGGQTFNSYELSLTLTVLVQKSADTVADLETLIESALENTTDWALAGVDEPTVVTVSGMDLLGTVIHISKNNLKL